MMRNAILLEKIEKYLQDELPLAERQEFEEALITDPMLAHQVEEHRMLMDAMRGYGRRNKLKNRLNRIHGEMKLEEQPETEQTLPNGWKVFWNKNVTTMAVAASVAALTFLGTWFGTSQLRQPAKQSAGYVELRREVAQIKQNQAVLHNMVTADATRPVVPPNPGQFSGTGFALSSNGYIVTSFHVIEGADSLFIESKSGQRYKVEDVYRNPARDLAILKINDPAFDGFAKLPYQLKESSADLGEKVFTLGFPREDVVYGEGSISSRTGYLNDTTAYQISIPLNPGNSGGPLLDDKGNLIGVISGKQMGLEGASFAIKSSYLLELLEELPENTEPVQLPSGNGLRGQGRPQQLKKLQDFVFMVKVYNQDQR